MIIVIAYYVLQRFHVLSVLNCVEGVKGEGEQPRRVPAAGQVAW